MAEMKNQSGIRGRMTYETAEWLNDWANIGLIVAIAASLIATVLVIWTGGVKEAAWNAARNEAAIKVADLSVQGDTLRKETAEANARAVEAQVELARFKAPRSISAADGAKLIATLSTFAGTNAAIYILGDGPEPNNLGASINEVLKQSRWDVQTWHWSGGGAVTGVIVFPRPGSGAQIDAICDALVNALNSAHVTSGKHPWPGPKWEEFGGMLNGPTAPPPTAAPIRIVIGTKPQ